MVLPPPCTRIDDGRDHQLAQRACIINDNRTQAMVLPLLPSTHAATQRTEPDFYCWPPARFVLASYDTETPEQPDTTAGMGSSLNIQVVEDMDSQTQRPGTQWEALVLIWGNQVLWSSMLPPPAGFQNASATSGLLGSQPSNNGGRWNGASPEHSPQPPELLCRRQDCPYGLSPEDEVSRAF